MSGDSNFFPLCEYLQVIMNMPQVLIWGLQIKFSKKGNLQRESANNEDWLPVIRNSKSLIISNKNNISPKRQLDYYLGRLFLSCSDYSLNHLPVVFFICWLIFLTASIFYLVRYDEERSYKRSVR